MSKHEKIARLLTKPYILINGVFQCTAPVPVAKSAGQGLTGFAQGFLKGWPRLYQFLVETFSPVLVSRGMKRALKSALDRHGDADTVVNLGSGPLGLPSRPDIINVDITPFGCVDICADATNLPFSDGVVDCLINLAMLEHVPDPHAVLKEMRRVLKPGGDFLCYVPFCQPVHAAPSDYNRWTKDGAVRLFPHQDVLNTGVGSGPTSGWLWITIEWLSLALSFGNRHVKDLLALSFMLVLFPLKYLDLYLENHPEACRISSAFYVEGSKVSDPQEDLGMAGVETGVSHVPD
jgi:SAM-dependent methyltransferase